MIFNIEHCTKYHYSTPVTSLEYLRLTPITLSNQRVLEWNLDVPGNVQTMTDGYGNVLNVISIDKKHKDLTFKASGRVEINGLEVLGDGGINPLLFLRNTKLTSAGEKIKDFVKPYMSDMRSITESLQDMARSILNVIPYDKGVTDSHTCAEDAFAAGHGVCQDHTQVFIACCRLRGIPARYVSGYLFSDDAGHIASHAWAEAWYDGGWHTYDISNLLFAPSRHVKVAIGLDYQEACPIRGIRTGGGAEVLDTYTQVNLLNDTPLNDEFTFVDKMDLDTKEQGGQQQQQMMFKRSFLNSMVFFNIN